MEGSFKEVVMPETHTPVKPTSIQDFEDLVGTTLGPTEWHEVTQERIDGFAEMTGDHQSIHVYPERVAQSYAGSAIAHGLHDLSMGPRFAEDLMAFDGFPHSLDHDWLKVCLPAPSR